MTFSISATGTREEVSASLERQTVADPLGTSVLRLLDEAIREAPDALGGRTLRYSVSASGHADRAYSSPYLSVTLGATAQPDPAASETADDAGQTAAAG